MRVNNIYEIRQSLLAWFESNGRHSIPWKLNERGSIPTRQEKLPIYPIWIAEVMLQQTQFKVVVPYWERWMQSFSNLSDLASADESEVLLLWQGLGYYSRAKRLHASSKLLVQLMRDPSSSDLSQWPSDLKIWMSLPGIGRSTAGSILSSALNAPTPILDGNVKRVLSRILGSKIPPNKNLSQLWDLSDFLLDPKEPRNFNQALMDLGATICRTHNPSCIQCPWHNYCDAYHQGNQEAFPVKDQKQTFPFITIGIGIVFNNANEVLIDQRPLDTSMGGMWEFPGGKKEEVESIEFTIARELKEELAIEVKVGEKLIEFDHSYSHKKLHFIVHLCELISGKPKPLSCQQFKWIKIDNLDKYPFPAANARMIQALRQKAKLI